MLVNFADPNTEVDGAKAEPTTQHPFLSDKNVRRPSRWPATATRSPRNCTADAGQATANILVGPAKFVSKNTTYKFDVDGRQDAAGSRPAGARMARRARRTASPCTSSSRPPSTRCARRSRRSSRRAGSRLGAKVELKSIDAGVYFSSDAGNPDTAGHFYADFEMFTNGPASPYPIAFMESFKSDKPATDLAQKSNSWAGANYKRWVNDDFNKLYNQALTELDPDKQVPLFIGMNDLVVNEVVRIPLVRAPVSTAPTRSSRATTRRRGSQAPTTRATGTSRSKARSISETAADGPRHLSGAVGASVRVRDCAIADAHSTWRAR